MRRVMVVTLVALLVGACGSDPAPSATGEGKKYVDALLQGYRASSARDVFTGSEAVCISKHVVDSVGVDAIKGAGITPAEVAGKGSFQLIGSKLAPANRQKLADVFVSGECFDLAALLIKRGAAASFSGVSKAGVHCMFTEMAKPAPAKQAFADSVLGRPGADAEMKAAFSGSVKVLDAATTCKVGDALKK